MKETNTEKYIVRIINGTPYKVKIHYKNKGETFQEKMKRVIKTKLEYDRTNNENEDK